MITMKPNKSLVQPTRIMPKRNSSRQTNVDESISKKRKAKSGDDVPTKGKRKSKAVDTSVTEESDMQNVSCGSPDANCSICLCSIDNRSFTDSCYHTFCFKCLLEWSRVRAVCPLCKKSFTAIVHDYRSHDDYQVYKLPRHEDADQVRLSVNHAHSLITAPPIALIQPVGFWISPDSHASRLLHSEQMIAMRRRIYTEELQLQGTWSSTGQIIRPGYVSPSLFANNPQAIERLRPWIIRDLHVIISRFEVPFVCNLVIDLLQQFHITSEEFYGRLFPHVGLSTRLFLQELDSFSRSPYDMATYDELAVYNLSSAVSIRQASNHVENISSSSDNSDIEITQTDTRPAFSSMHQVNGLFAALRGRVWSAIHGGWDSPIPGPSGYSLTLQRHDESIANVSIVEELSGESNSAVDGSMTVLSDGESDVVVVDSNYRHSPIMLSSSENDDELTVVSSNVVPPTRRRRKKKRRDTNREIVHQVDDSNNMPDTTDISVDDNDSLPTTSQIHQIVSLNANKETQDQLISKYPHESKFPSCGTSGLPARNSLSEGEHSGCDTLKTCITRLPVRARRNRLLNNAEKDDETRSIYDERKIPACKKHISGHKSSKRKLSDDMLEACELNTTKVIDVKLDTGFNVEENSFTLALPGSTALCNDHNTSRLANESSATTDISDSSIRCQQASPHQCLHSAQTSSSTDAACSSSGAASEITSPLPGCQDTLNSMVTSKSLALSTHSSYTLQPESQVLTADNKAGLPSSESFEKMLLSCVGGASAESFTCHIEQGSEQGESSVSSVTSQVRCDSVCVESLTVKQVQGCPSPQSNDEHLVVEDQSNDEHLVVEDQSNEEHLVVEEQSNDEHLVVEDQSNEEHLVVEDSEDDDDEYCISLKADVESSDSEIEWLPNVSSGTSVRRHPCISVSSDECVDVVELINQSVDARAGIEVNVLDIEEKQQTSVSNSSAGDLGLINSALELQENCGNGDCLLCPLQESIIAEDSTSAVQGSSDTTPCGLTSAEQGSSDTTPCGLASAVQGSSDTTPCGLTSAVQGNSDTTTPCGLTSAVQGNSDTTTPCGLASAVQGSSDTTPCGLTSAVQGNSDATPCGLTSAVQGNSDATPCGLASAVQGNSDATPCGLASAVQGSSDTTPCGLTSAVQGNSDATPCGLASAVQGNSDATPCGLTSAVQGNSDTTPCGVVKDSGRENELMNCDNTSADCVNNVENGGV